MNLDRVTITGADDSVEPQQIVDLWREFPFSEWGLLFSQSHQARPRWPSDQWVDKLLDIAPKEMNLCAHLCGVWVRDIVLNGLFSFKSVYAGWFPRFQRVQLNFHGRFHKSSPKFVDILRENSRKHFILQHDSVNDEWIETLTGGNVVPLFDTSGGAGMLRDNWPAPIGEYCGYAGGLSADNVAAEIPKILRTDTSAFRGMSIVDGENIRESYFLSKVNGRRCWIDCETRVRSDDDRVLDLDKCRKFLEQSRHFVV